MPRKSSASQLDGLFLLSSKNTPAKIHSTGAHDLHGNPTYTLEYCDAGRGGRTFTSEQLREAGATVVGYQPENWKEKSDVAWT